MRARVQGSGGDGDASWLEPEGLGYVLDEEADHLPREQIGSFKILIVPLIE
jgi:hypothetical protein